MNARNAIRLRALSCGCALIVAVLAASGVANLFREDRPERDVNVVTFRTDLSQTVAVFTTSIVTLADRAFPLALTASSDWTLVASGADGREPVVALVVGHTRSAST